MEKSRAERRGDDSLVCDDSVLTVAATTVDSGGNKILVTVSAVLAGTDTATWINEAQPGCCEVVVYCGPDSDGDRGLMVVWICQEQSPTEYVWNCCRAKLGKAIEETRRVDPW